MPEIPSAWKCDYCGTLMEPIERKTDRWHTKWCSVCWAKLHDVFVGGRRTYMTVRELIAELQKCDPEATVVVEGTSWFGCNEPERFDAVPEIFEYTVVHDHGCPCCPETRVPNGSCTCGASSANFNERLVRIQA